MGVFLLMRAGRESNMASIFQTGWDGTITFYSGTGNNGKIVIVDEKDNEKGNWKLPVWMGKTTGSPLGICGTLSTGHRCSTERAPRLPQASLRTSSVYRRVHRHMQ